MVTQVAAPTLVSPPPGISQKAWKEANDLKDALLGLGHTKEELLSKLEKVVGPPWPEVYINRDTKKVYKPHHDLEREIVYTDTPKRILVKGSEGSGKSVSGIIKALERIRRGCSGCLISPVLDHSTSCGAKTAVSTPESQTATTG